jgi:hypothetical protein
LFSHPEDNGQDEPTTVNPQEVGSEFTMTTIVFSFPNEILK